MCHIEGCTRKADRIWSGDTSKRICETHFKRWENTGSFDVIRPEGWGEEKNRKYKAAKCVHCGGVKKIAAKGLCRACYGRFQRSGSLKFQRKGIINTCTMKGCSDNVVSNGLCDKHRSRLAKYGVTETLRPEDWGSRMNHPLYVYWADTKRRETLNLHKEWKDEFWAFAGDVKERPSKNHFLRAVDISKTLGPNNWQWVEGLTDANRKIASRLKAKKHDNFRLNLSAEERQEWLEKADNKCEICKTEFSGKDCPVTGEAKTRSLCIDHCHDTGEIRGVLCNSCNTGLGYFKDDIELLEKAILYLN